MGIEIWMINPFLFIAVFWVISVPVNFQVNFMRRQSNSCLILSLQLIILVSSSYFLFNVNFTNHNWIFRLICSLITYQFLLCATTGFIAAFSVWWLLLSSHHYLPVFKILVYDCLGVNSWEYCLRRMRGAGSVCCADKA